MRKSELNTFVFDNILFKSSSNTYVNDNILMRFSWKTGWFGYINVSKLMNQPLFLTIGQKCGSNTNVF